MAFPGTEEIVLLGSIKLLASLLSTTAFLIKIENHRCIAPILWSWWWRL